MGDRTGMAIVSGNNGCREKVQSSPGPSQRLQKPTEICGVTRNEDS